jgi:hypothetical protein
MALGLVPPVLPLMGLPQQTWPSSPQAVHRPPAHMPPELEPEPQFSPGLMHLLS